MTDQKLPTTGNDTLSNSNDDSIYVNSEDELEAIENGHSLFGGEDEFMEPGEEVKPDEMDALMDQYLNEMETDSRTGQVIKVPVVSIKADHVLVDVGGKSEGIINLNEFCRTGEDPGIKVGDELEAVVRGTDHDTGMVRLSYQDARRRVAIKEVEEALANKTPLKGKVIRTVKGGLILDIGTTAFLPASQVDLRRVENFEEWIGREVEGYVIEHKPEKRRIIISRRRLLEEQRESLRKEALEKLTVGQDVEAPVKRIVEFGAFIDLGSIDGLVPRAEISWDRNVKPDEYFTIGETVTARIIDIDIEGGKVTLSRRAIQGNPWDTAAERYPADSQVSGKIVSTTNYGAFVRIEEGLDGMIHISDMGWDSAGKRPSDYVQVGQEISAAIIDIDCSKKRISLGLKQLTADPWAEIEERYPAGKRIKGTVTGLTKYGAFVELEPGIEGMIHVSDFTWEKRISQPREIVQKGDEVEVVILSVDLDKRRIALGVKQLSDSPFDAYTTQHRVGEIVEGVVSSVTDFGVFVKLTDHIEGFMHVSQCDRDRVDSPASLFTEGSTIKVKISKIDRKAEKVSLSRRQMLRDQERDTIRQYQKKATEGWSTGFGELLSEIVLEDDLPPEPPKKEEPKAETPPPVAEELAEEPKAEAPAAEPEEKTLED